MPVQDLFDTPQVQTPRELKMALLVQLLQSLLDDKQDDDAILEGEAERAEVLTRPHFMPSGG
jgi:hypothetical protein